jgi:hypothetical protein
VSNPSIEVADPTPEGSRIVEALRARGLYVLERSFDGLAAQRDVALVIVAIDSADGASALERIARGGTQVPVIAIGTADDGSSLPEPEARLPRPVSIERLVRKVETLLAPPETRLKSIVRPTPEASERPFTTSAQVRTRERSALPPPPPVEARPRREPTIDLFPAREPTMELRHEISVDLRTLAPPPERTPTSVRPSEPPPTTDGASSSPAIRLSPKLETLLESADRRLFPTEPPLDLRFVAGDESAAELVPDALLDDVAIDWHEEDPLNAYTQFVSADVSLAPAAPPAPSSDSESSSKATSSPKVATPASRPGRRPTSRPPPPIEAPEMTADPATLYGRKSTATATPDAGELPLADWLRYLWRKSADPRPHRLDVSFGERLLAITVARGEVLELTGPVATCAVEQLKREGRNVPAPIDEASARATLDREAASGRASRLELERRLRQARERLLHEIVVAPHTTYLATALDPKLVPRAPVVTGTLREILLEGARRLAGADLLVSTFGTGGVRLTPLAPEFAASARLEPELYTMLGEAEGRPIRDVLEEAPLSEGLAGAMFLMLAVGALKTTEPVLDPAPAAASLAFIEELYRTARDGNYFAILGAPLAAGPRELEQSYRERRRLLEGARTGSSERHATMRTALLETLDEAWFALEDERIRSRYLEALGAP